MGGKWENLVGHVLQERYILRSLVSAGPYYAEFVAFEAPPAQGGEPLSVTLFIPGEADYEWQVDQIATARRLVHPNLLRIADGGECAFDETTLLFVATESAAATLAQVTTDAPLDLTSAVALTKDLVAGLGYIHSQGFVCGNLARDTVVRAGTSWKIGDLSQLRVAGPYEGSAAAGPDTPPEASLGSIGPSWDVWALGAILRAAVAGEVRRNPVFDAIVAGCLEPDPAKQLSLGDISGLLEKEEPAPVVAPTEPPGAGEPSEPSHHGSRFAVAAIALAAFLSIVVLTGVALRRRQTPAPAPAAVAATPAPAPDRAVSPPVGRPSPFTGKVETEAKRSPAPPHSAPPRPSISPPPITQHGVSAESLTRSANGAAGEGAVGPATFFGDNLNGKLTASGELFDNAALTAAHPFFPFGTRVRVTNLRNNKTVVVRVNDRASPSARSVITVTRAAADQLGFVRAGSARVRVEPVE